MKVSKKYVVMFDYDGKTRYVSGLEWRTDWEEFSSENLDDAYLLCYDEHAETLWQDLHNLSVVDFQGRKIKRGTNIRIRPVKVRVLIDVLKPESGLTSGGEDEIDD